MVLPLLHFCLDLPFSPPPAFLLMVYDSGGFPPPLEIYGGLAKKEKGGQRTTEGGLGFMSCFSFFRCLDLYHSTVSCVLTRENFFTCHFVCEK